MSVKTLAYCEQDCAL